MHYRGSGRASTWFLAFFYLLYSCCGGTKCSFGIGCPEGLKGEEGDLDIAAGFVWVILVGAIGSSV